FIARDPAGAFRPTAVGVVSRMGASISTKVLAFTIAPPPLRRLSHNKTDMLFSKLTPSGRLAYGIILIILKTQKNLETLEQVISNRIEDLLLLCGIRHDAGHRHCAGHGCEDHSKITYLLGSVVTRHELQHVIAARLHHA